MGRRKGKTGAGGAVVSSLSKNAGGRVVSKNSGVAESSSNAGAGVVSAGWVGKTPVVFLREWCARNNRRGPVPYAEGSALCEYMLMDQTVIHAIRCRFRVMDKGAGIMSCRIPAGRKKGTGKPKGYETVVGIGAHPGEEWAALRVLHQVERGKPLERILPPEFRNSWKEMDKVFADMEEQRKRREFLDEKRKKRKEGEDRRERMEKKAAIKVRMNDRLAIEDALQASTISSGFEERDDKESGTVGLKFGAPANLEQELLRLGFAPLDAAAAAERFDSREGALDFLCMNLDEKDLPPVFAPRAEIGMIRYAESSIRSGVDTRTVELLADSMAISRLAAERALRQVKSDRDVAQALISLYTNLTNTSRQPPKVIPHPDIVQKAKGNEEEALKAIFSQDIRVGPGAAGGFESLWAAVVTIGRGRSVLGSKSPVEVVFIDGDGLYPYTSPVVFIRGQSVSAARRRAVLRALAAEIDNLRTDDGPYFAVYAIVQYLSDMSELQLMKASSGLRRSVTLDETKRLVASSSSQSTNARQTLTQSKVGQTVSRCLGKPKRVYAPKPSPKLSRQLWLRGKLPVFRARSEILGLVAFSNVVVISGQTGSGKTTQVPQYLLEEAAENGRPVSIVCTQPRRIAAMSVAQRVASERCEKIGESVGYQVKLKSRSSADTRLLFCTTGVLLRRLQSDSSLDSFTHVIVDEVHERTVETDFLLIILKDILKRRSKLRVVLMSATLEAEKLSSYFSLSTSSVVPIVNIPGRTFPVGKFYLEDAIALTNYTLKPGDRYAKKMKRRRANPAQGTDGFPARVPPMEMAAVHMPAEEGQHTNESIVPQGKQDLGPWDSEDVDEITYSPLANNIEGTVAMIDESLVNIDLIELLVRRIALGEKECQAGSGAILVFLPGIADIMTLIDRLRRAVGSEQLYPLPLHSSLLPETQSAVFDPPPQGKTKVICSTNIAEASVTVPDVTVVIDSLRMKQMSFDPLNSASMLDEVFISQAEARQRAGRAGRVSRGSCFRLVTRRTFESKLQSNPTPEIQRVSLEHLVLNIMALSLESPESMLTKAIDPPDSKAVALAISSLVSIGAVVVPGNGYQSGTAGKLTPLGRHLVALPVDARLGKLLIYGAIFGCLSAALTIAATLTCGSPFVSPLDKREEARVARDRFARGRSDLLTFARVYDEWKRESCGAEFCSENFVSQRSLMTIEQQRRLLLSSMRDAEFAEVGQETIDEHSNSGRLLRAVICSALYPNLVRADALVAKYQATASGAVEMKTLGKTVRLRARDGSRVFVHPSSVVFGHESELEYGWMAYFRRVRTTKDYMREVSEVSPISVLLFGGNIQVEYEKGRVTVGEGQWATFKASAREAVLLKELKRQMDRLLEWKLENPAGDLKKKGAGLNEAVIKLIKSQL